MKKAYCIILFLFAAASGTCSCAYALDLTRVKAAFLAGDYKAAIKEGEQVMEETDETPELDQLYYLLGVSYFKDGNYLRASDIFEIIVKEFKGSSYTPDALLGLADTYYMLGDQQKAKKMYEDLIAKADPATSLDPMYYRLSMLAAKEGDVAAANAYREKIEFPAVYAPGGFNDMNTVPLFLGYYTVQVGSFGQKSNALKLQKELQGKGYLVFMESASSIGPNGPDFYRVKVGRYTSKSEADDAAKRLADMGYPVRVTP